MYVNPGAPFHYKVEFEAGGQPAIPTLAAYVVSDVDGIVVPTTPITLTPGQSTAWVSVAGVNHVLDPGEKYRQHRLEISHTTDGLVFEQRHVYFILPDLRLPYEPMDVRRLVGLNKAELPDDDVDFCRSYIDLVNSEISVEFLAALNGVDEGLQNDARQLIFYHTIRNLIPQIRLRGLKTVESETSRMTRMANDSAFDLLEQALRDKYDLYYRIIKGPTQSSSTFLVLDAPTDPVTGGG